MRDDSGVRLVHLENSVDNKIHSTALVAPGVRMGRGNEIGPFAVIEDDVELGNGNRIHAHAVLKRGCRLGDENAVHEHAVLGAWPQDLGFKDKATYVEIGNGNVLREGVTIHRASRDGESTRLGNDNFLMVNAHLGHDCQLGNRIVIAPSSALGGHVRVEDRAFISGGVMVHQFVRIGSFAMIGGNSKITQDALPFLITDGVPGRARGLNLVGLKRAGFSGADLRELKQAYRGLFRSQQGLEHRLQELGRRDNPHVAHLVAFIAGSKRGFHRDREA